MAVHRGALVRRDPQPLEHRPHARRLERRARRRRSPAGLVPAALGSDGAGSIRIPAAWTGLVGLKPQRGRISTWPEAEAFNGLTCIGPLARTVADAALLLDATAGNIPADLHKPPPPPGAVRRVRRPRPAPAADRDLLRDPVRRLRSTRTTSTGRRSRPSPSSSGRWATRSSPPTPTTASSGRRSSRAGMAGVNQWLSENIDDRSNLEPRTRTHARFGRLLSGLPLRASRAAEPALRRRLGRIFDRHDLVLTPTTAKPPARDLQARRTRLLGHQHRGRRGLPLRVRLERGRLAGDQRPGRDHRGRDCRSAPSSSGPKTARRCCSNWRARSSARWVASSRRPTRAAMRRPGQSRAAVSPGGRTRRGCDRSRDGRDRARTRAGCGRRGPRR